MSNMFCAVIRYIMFPLYIDGKIDGDGYAVVMVVVQKRIMRFYCNFFNRILSVQIRHKMS